MIEIIIFISVIVIVSILIFVGTIILISMIRKYNINEYLYCSILNVIWMRGKIKQYKDNSYKYNKMKFFRGFNKFRKNQYYICFTHKIVLDILLKREARGKIKICVNKKIPLKNIDMNKYYKLLNSEVDMTNLQDRQMSIVIFKVEKQVD